MSRSGDERQNRVLDGYGGSHVCVNKMHSTAVRSHARATGASSAPLPFGPMCCFVRPTTHKSQTVF